MDNYISPIRPQFQFYNAIVERIGFNFFDGCFNLFGGNTSTFDLLQQRENLINIAAAANRLNIFNFGGLIYNP